MNTKSLIGSHRFTKIMLYKIQLITDLVKLTSMINKTESKLFRLNIEHGGEIIDGEDEEKAATRKAENIALTQSRLNTAIATAAALPDDSPLKPKELGTIETLKARLYNLNLPVTTDDSTDAVDSAIDAGELQTLIVYYQGVLAELNARKVQLEGGNP